MRNYDKLLDAGNNAQLIKLRRDHHKKDWNDMSFDEMNSLIYEEYEELHDELITRTPDYNLIKFECADLMNALNFMVCHCDKILESEEVREKREGQAKLF